MSGCVSADVGGSLTTYTRMGSSQVGLACTGIVITSIHGIAMAINPCVI